MRIRISIEQIVDIHDAMANDIDFALYGPENMSDDDKVDYLVARFAEDIDKLVKHDMVSDQITVDYLED